MEHTTWWIKIEAGTKSALLGPFHSEQEMRSAKESLTLRASKDTVSGEYRTEEVAL